MNFRPQLRSSILATALAATVATAWAAYDSRNSTLVPGPSHPPQPMLEARPLVQEVPAVVANEQGIAPNEQVVTSSTPGAAPLAPVESRQPLAATPVETAPREPAITVEQQRLSLDQRIQADVMDLLARNPNLSGRIGVVSDDAVVTLTGYTTTSGMAWRAAREARGVMGVRQVVNEIRPRVGGITS